MNRWKAGLEGHEVRVDGVIGWADGREIVLTAV